MLGQRVLTAAVGIPLLLILVHLGGWYLGAVVLLLSLVGLHEFFRLAERCGLRPDSWAGYVAAVLVIGAVVWGSESLRHPGLPWSMVDSLLIPILALAAASALMRQLTAGESPGAIANTGALVLGLVYLPVLLTYVVRLRELSSWPTPLPGTAVEIEAGAGWVVVLLFTCWAEDTAAYGVGRAMGRHKLCPTISPGKTVEGSVAGWVAAVVAAAALGRWLGLPLTHGMILGGIIGVVAQLGDLSKSVMKRQAGVKDSGAIIPGHGGVLDRFDSLLFSAPVAFYYLGALGLRAPI